MLVLDDDSTINGYDATYHRLARDSSADYGIPPVITNGSWRQTNASRYVRKFQSRRSLLVWKVFGRRLDGWTNADHPTESTPGDHTTLPAGASRNDADIDYLGDIMPPPDSDPAQYPRLTEDEKMTIARWIDLGCPITSQDGGIDQDLGWFADELRPTLDISLPLAGRREQPLDRFRIGAFDYYAGLDMSTLSVKADFEVGGRAPGTELAAVFQSAGEHIWEMVLPEPITQLDRGTLTVSIQDQTGNVTELARTFSVGTNDDPPTLDISAIDPTGVLQLTLAGEPGRPHTVEVSGDLSGWVPWMTLIDFDGAQTVADPLGQRRFYRARGE